MARRRYQCPPVLRAKHGIGKNARDFWSIRWREDVVRGGVTKREARKTRLGQVFDKATGVGLTYAQALRERDAVLFKCNGRAYKPTQSLTFGELVGKWRKLVFPLLEPTTQTTAKWYVDKFLLPYFGAIEVEAMTQEAVQCAVADMAAAGRGRPVIRNAVGTLQGIFKIARTWGHSCPAILRKGLTMPNHIPKPETSKFYSVEEALQIFASMGPYFGLCLKLQCALALRPCEILGLSVDDFDFANKTVYVRQKAWHSEIRVLKSKRPKVKSMAPEVERVVAEFLRSGWTPNPKRLLFCNARSLGPLHQKFLRNMLYETLKHLGFPKRGLHAFRHTAASVLFSQGGSLLTTGSILGHARNTNITLLYGHILGMDEIIATNGLATAIFAGAKKGQKSVDVVSRCVREKSEVIENVGT